MAPPAAARHLAARLLLACLLAHGAGAKKFVRPPYSIPVWVKANVVGIRAVSAATSSFIFEGSLQYAWRDDSLYYYFNDGDTYADLPLVNGRSPAAYSDFYLQAVASYVPEFAGDKPVTGLPSLNNAIGVVGRLAGSSAEIWKIEYGVPDWLLLDVKAEEGDYSTWVTGLVTYTGLQVQAPQELRDFPYDVQTLSLRLVNRAAVTPLNASDMILKFVAASSAPGGLASGDPDGYKIVATSATTATNGEGFGTLTLSWTLRRLPDFFVNRFVLPLSLVTVLIIFLLAANPAARAMASFTMIGTVVSFLFVSGQSVPALPYRTRLDNYFTLHFFLAFFVGLYNLFATNRADRLKLHPITSVTSLCCKPRQPPVLKSSGPGKKGGKAAAAAAAGAAAAALVEVKVDELDAAGLLRAMFKRDAEKAAKDKVKADEEKDKAAAQVQVDSYVAAIMVCAYVAAVPCIFFL